ncbi:MAG: hypothetical protein ACRCW2_13150 [Cellulosilyticaceae bacterium]
MEFYSNIQTITQMKKALSEAIVYHDYNLICDEVIELSQALDHMMVPVFQSQLDLYNQITTKMNYYSF